MRYWVPRALANLGAMPWRARGYFDSIDTTLDEESLLESPRPPPSPPPSPPNLSPSKSRLRSRLAFDNAGREVESASWRNSAGVLVSRGSGNTASGSQSSRTALVSSPLHGPMPPNLKRPSPPPLESPCVDSRCAAPLPGGPAPQVRWPATQPSEAIKSHNAVENQQVDSGAKHQSQFTRVAARVLRRPTPQPRPPTQDRSSSTPDMRRQSSKQSVRAPGSQTARSASGSQTARSAPAAMREAPERPWGAKIELAPRALLTHSTAVEEPQSQRIVIRQPSLAMQRSLTRLELHTGNGGSQHTPPKWSSTACRSEFVTQLKRRTTVPLQGLRTPASRPYDDLSDGEALHDSRQSSQQPPSRGAGGGGHATHTGLQGHAGHSCWSPDGAHLCQAGGVIAGPESVGMFVQRTSHTPKADDIRQECCDSRPKSETNISSSSGETRGGNSVLAHENSNKARQEVGRKMQLPPRQERAYSRSSPLLPHMPAQDQDTPLDTVDDPWRHSHGSNSCDGDTSCGCAMEGALASARANSKAISQSVQLSELRGSGADDGAGPSVPVLATGSRHSADGKAGVTGSSINHDADGGAGQSHCCTAGTSGKHKEDSIADKWVPASRDRPSNSRFKFGSRSGPRGRLRAALSASILWRATPNIF